MVSHEDEKGCTRPLACRTSLERAHRRAPLELLASCAPRVTFSPNQRTEARERQRVPAISWIGYSYHPRGRTLFAHPFKQNTIEVAEKK